MDKKRFIVLFVLLPALFGAVVSMIFKVTAAVIKAPTTADNATMQR